MQSSIAGGRRYILSLLKLRQRSEKEIRDKLKARNYSPELITGLVDYFKGLGYINDREFAAAWINSRLTKPLGFKAIEIELRQKGICDEIIAEFIREKKASVSEAGIVKELVIKRWNKLQEKKEPLVKARVKLYAYLLRRGFESEIVSEAVNELTRGY